MYNKNYKFASFLPFPCLCKQKSAQFFADGLSEFGVLGVEGIGVATQLYNRTAWSSLSPPKLELPSLVVVEKGKFSRFMLFVKLPQK